MLLGEAKDMVRAGIGHDDISTDMLNFFLASGRRQIEKQGNFYWMESSTTFNLTINQGDYTVASSPISVTTLKDIHILMAKDPDDTVYYEVPWGVREQLDRVYGSTDEGAPEVYTMSGTDIISLFPENPDQAYNMKLIYYGWTSNPASNLSDDELLKRFPEALIYSSIAYGLNWLTHNTEVAQPWDLQFKMEVANIKRHDHRRKQLDQLVLRPARGPYQTRPNTKWRTWM